jgi:hypothetical protein
VKNTSNVVAASGSGSLSSSYSVNASDFSLFLGTGNTAASLAINASGYLGGPDRHRLEVHHAGGRRR